MTVPFSPRPLLSAGEGDSHIFSPVSERLETGLDRFAEATPLLLCSLSAWRNAENILQRGEEVTVPFSRTLFRQFPLSLGAERTDSVSPDERGSPQDFLLIETQISVGVRLVPVRHQRLMVTCR